MSKTLQFGKYSVDFSHGNKNMFPGEGITKRDLVEYYLEIADTFLRYTRERPVMVKRFPDGIKKNGFYQKQAAEHFPDWFKTVNIKRKQGGTLRHITCENIAQLAYLGQQAAVTYHGWLSRFDKIKYPDKLVFDLDPPKGNFDIVRQGAAYYRNILRKIGMTPFVMTTGSEGLHVVVPLDRSARFDRARQLAQEVSRLLAERHPDELTVEQRKNKRRGRLFLDTNRNAYGQTSVVPYSVRSLPGAPVAMPLTWDEVGKQSISSRSYSVQNVPKQLTRRGDPWQSFNRHASSISSAANKLNRLQS